MRSPECTLAHPALLGQEHGLQPQQCAVGGGRGGPLRVGPVRGNTVGRRLRGQLLQHLRQRIHGALHLFARPAYRAPARHHALQQLPVIGRAPAQRRVALRRAVLGAQRLVHQRHGALLRIGAALGKSPPVGAVADKIAQQLLGAVIADGLHQRFVRAQVGGCSRLQHLAAKSAPGFVEQGRRALEQHGA